MSIDLILTHPGGAHKDDFLACCLLVSKHGAPIERREPEPGDLDNLAALVVDVGGEHAPERGNFDHHQFPRDHEPICALSLVLMHLGLYDDAKMFCDWLEPAEWFDTRGANGTAKWLGVERDIISKLNSPIDVSLLRRFAQASRLQSGDLLYEVMRWVGEDLIGYLETLRERLTYIAQHGELMELQAADGESFKVMFMPRTDPLPDEPSMGLGRYLDSIGESEKVAGLVYPDRRGSGYGLSRHNDHPRLEFTRIDGEDDVHFAHARGFVAKTSATEKERLKELLLAAWL
ncbi:MAG: MYG1 family protein [Roseibacillus sp.]|nr:MYG1 family protein [Roseibacillus sp.]|tara:strand:- start:45 stop:911 length:867 start_codon:yes stop_codon:yes gene_type:complete